MAIRHWRHWLLGACTALLVACGGDGADDANGGAPPLSPADGGALPFPIDPNGPDRTRPDGDRGTTPDRHVSMPYQPLTWPQPLPLNQYRKPDGTLVTNIGGRVRNRHAREDFIDNYNLFAPHYFERRTHDITIYDNADPADSRYRILTVVIRPQWWLFDFNFRHGYIGSPADKNLYNDNSNAERVLRLAPGTEIKTPLANYDMLEIDPRLSSGAKDYVPPSTPPGEDYLIVKEIRQIANALDAQGNPQFRRLQAGDQIEFELGIFLAGEQQRKDELGNPGRFNYYADALLYQVGSTGVRPWMRTGGDGTFRNGTLSMALWPTPIPAFALQGGTMTTQEDTSRQPERMLMQAGSNIAGYNMQPWVEGRRLMHTSFLTGTHSEDSNTVFAEHIGKAGPALSQTRCIDCHTANGKSSPVPGLTLDRLAVFVGDRDAEGKIVPDSRFGVRLQQGRITDYLDARRTQAIVFDGREGEARIAAQQSIRGNYADGTPYELLRPVYAINDRRGEGVPMPKALSVRAAPHLVGMGLLEAIPEATLEAIAASQPAGMAGKLQIVRDPRDPSMLRVGRFGWKAGNPTLEAQIAAAFDHDMGVTSPLHPKRECAVGVMGEACRQADAREAGVPGVSQFELDRIALYLSLLGVPPQRAFPDPQAVDRAAEQTRVLRVKEGERHFIAAQCAVCHVPEVRTGQHRFAELRDQTIRPYTDLLLHDMGAELADPYEEGGAAGSEWRTAPLWGIGLLPSIDANVRYLHDGRARSLEEAILWHGGQAAGSAAYFRNLDKEGRAQLLEFLRSL